MRPRTILGGGARRRLRAMVAVVAAAVLTMPATALASALGAKVPDGHYATVVSPRIPTGEALSFTLARGVNVTNLELSCFPGAAVASLVHASGYANVFVIPRAPRITLANGRFNFSGVADVSSSPRLGDKVTTASFTLKGHYVPHGPSYEYFSAMDNQETATLVFEGTATTSACTGLPANRTFRLYATKSVG